MDVLRIIWQWMNSVTLADIIIRLAMLSTILTGYFLLESYLMDRHQDAILLQKLDELNTKLDLLKDTDKVILISEEIIEEPVIEKEETKEELPKVDPITSGFIGNISKSDYTSKRFRYRKFSYVGQNRKEDYGQIKEKKIEKFFYHNGGKMLNYDEMYKILSYVMGRMPNIKSSEGLKLLILESCMAETLFGKVSYVAASERGDHGLGQIRVTSAEDLLNVWLTYDDVLSDEIKPAVMEFYDTELSLKDNLYSNVHFTFAIMIQEYWRKVPNLNQMDLSHVGDRAILWKSVYNTNAPHAEGTVKAYVDRVAYFHKQNKTGVIVEIVAFD